MRLRPYRTADNKIDGVVITLIDIDEMKRTLAEQEDARIFAQAVVESTPEPMAVLDPHLRIKIANAAFHRLFKTTPETTQERSFFEAVDERGQLGQVQVALEGLIGRGTPLVDHEVQLEITGGEVARVIINARQISSGERSYSLILLLLRRLS
jgi:two-component system, chemotaxis family, CheB/CheR fusion protein